MADDATSRALVGVYERSTMKLDDLDRIIRGGEESLSFALRLMRMQREQGEDASAVAARIVCDLRKALTIAEAIKEHEEVKA